MDPELQKKLLLFPAMNRSALFVEPIISSDSRFEPGEKFTRVRTIVYFTQTQVKASTLTSHTFGIKRMKKVHEPNRTEHYLLLHCGRKLDFPNPSFNFQQSDAEERGKLGPRCCFAIVPKSYLSHSLYSTTPKTDRPTDLSIKRKLSCGRRRAFGVRRSLEMKALLFRGQCIISVRDSTTVGKEPLPDQLKSLAV